MNKPTAIITGASGGLGKSLAIEMARKGYHLSILARRKDKLEELKEQIEKNFDTEVLVSVCDVTDEDRLRETVIKNTIEKFGSIDVVIANAGVTLRGPFSELNISDIKDLFDINFFGVLNITQASYDHLKESQGIVVIIGSVLGEIGIMKRSAYAASKFALKGFYESVRYEFKSVGINTILVQAGFINTELRKTKKSSFAVDSDIIAEKIVKKIAKVGFKKALLPTHARIFVFLNWILKRSLPNIIYRNRAFLERKIFK